MADAAQVGDPSERIAAVFGTIASTRMAGLPICNPALGVEALGFRPWAGGWVGVLVTPWSMNLLYLPDGPASWGSRPSGSAQGLTLPAGEYELLTAQEETLGPYLSGSLFSPMGAFGDMDQARAVAHEVMDQAFAPPPPAVPTEGGGALNRPISRRGLFGALLGGG